MNTPATPAGLGMAPKPEPRQLRLAAERLRQVAKASQLAVDKVPGMAWLIDGDAATLEAVARWLDDQAWGPVP